MMNLLGCMIKGNKEIASGVGRYTHSLTKGHIRPQIGSSYSRNRCFFVPARKLPHHTPGPSLHHTVTCTKWKLIRGSYLNMIFLAFLPGGGAKLSPRSRVGQAKTLRVLTKLLSTNPWWAETTRVLQLSEFTILPLSTLRPFMWHFVVHPLFPNFDHTTKSTFEETTRKFLH